MPSRNAHGVSSFGVATADAGFSLIELLLVSAIILILVGFSVFALLPHKNLYKVEDQSLRVLDFMRDSSQRALTGRQTIRLEIDLTDNQIRIVNDSTGTVLRRETLENAANVTMTQPATLVSGVMTGTSKPTNVNLPNPPNLAAATFQNNSQSHLVCALYYRSNGTITDSSNNLRNATFFLWTPQTATSTGAAHLGKPVRAITVFGPTGATKMWAYNGATTGNPFIAK